MQAKHKNRLIILLVFLLFAVPVIVAYMLATGLINLNYDKTKNNGVMISPPIKMVKISKAPWVTELNDHWTLVYRTAEVCQQNCLEWEDKLHRFNLTLAQNADKLELLILAKDFQLPNDDPYTHIKKVAIADDVALNRLFDELSTQSYGDGEGLYVVAPEGYLMMAFRPENTPSDIIKDLKLLVKRKG